MNINILKTNESKIIGLIILVTITIMYIISTNIINKSDSVSDMIKNFYNGNRLICNSGGTNFVVKDKTWRLLKNSELNNINTGRIINVQECKIFK